MRRKSLIETHELLATLELLAKRTDMWVHPVSFATVQSYLHGLSKGLKFAGIAYTSEQYQLAAEARGFELDVAVGLLRDFRKKGLSEAAMIQELIEVETEAYRRALQASSTAQSKSQTTG
jgi:hypothetical protein